MAAGCDVIRPPLHVVVAAARDAYAALMRRFVTAAVAAAVLFVVGLALGYSSSTTETVTVTVTTPARTTTAVSTETITDTITTTVTKVKTVTAPPPTSGVDVNYGEWGGLFRIYGANVRQTSSEYGAVIGQFEYLGGSTCELGYVEVRGTLFDAGGEIVGTALWNSATAPEGARLPMEVSGQVVGRPTRAQIVVTAANCKD